MACLKSREPRKSVNITVRLKSEHGWENARIRNVSSRGMMIHCEAPPGRGSYVEIRRGSYVVVGRIVWAAEDSFGLQAQDRIELASLAGTGCGETEQAGERFSSASGKAVAFRPQTIAEQAEASVRFARAFHYIAILTVSLAFSWLLFDTAAGALAHPLEAVSNVLRGGIRRG